MDPDGADPAGATPLTQADIPTLVKAVTDALSRKDPAAKDPPAIGSLPDGSLLAHVAVAGGADPPDGSPGIDASTIKPTDISFSVGAGLPPVPKKLVTRIQAGEYVDMSELMPDRIGLNEKEEKSKSRRKQVDTITEWIQCFSIYVAVLTAKHPSRIQDLMGYQALIVEACSEYKNDAWLGYDRRFRQMASASPGTPWAKIDATLWNMAFTGQAKVQCCKYCFSLTHMSEECDWAPAAAPAPLITTPAPTYRLNQPRHKSVTQQVCYSWNQSPDPHCHYPNCKYLHICLHCARDPTVVNKNHKAISCARHRPAKQQAQQPVIQGSSAQGQGSFRYHPY